MAGSWLQGSLAERTDRSSVQVISITITMPQIVSSVLPTA